MAYHSWLVGPGVLNWLMWPGSVDVKEPLVSEHQRRTPRLELESGVKTGSPHPRRSAGVEAKDKPIVGPKSKFDKGRTRMQACSQGEQPAKVVSAGGEQYSAGGGMGWSDARARVDGTANSSFCSAALNGMCLMPLEVPPETLFIVSLQLTGSMR